MIEQRGIDTVLTTPSDREIVITRAFDAPRELVFKAYTDPASIPQWWGPKIYETTVEKMDVRPGGEWRYVQRGPDGSEYGFHGTYREIKPPERLVYTFEFEGMPGHVSLETVTLEAHDGQTDLTITVLFDTVEDRDGMLKSGMETGMRETIDRLAELLAKEKAAKEGKLVITRIFDAPVALVWRAWAEPEHFMRWWGPKVFTSPACKMDFRVGGKYLFCMQSPEGQRFWSTGVYQKIDPLKEIVYSDSFADEAGNVVPASHYGMGGDFPLELQVTVTFEEHDGKTRMTLRHAGFPPGEMREMAGLGWNESFDKLAESLK